MESHAHGEALLEMASANDTWEKKLQDPSATPMFLPLEFLKSITCDFSTEQELGRGGYGVVYKGVLPSGKIIAVKKLFDLHKLGEEKFQNEVSYLMRIKHQNVVQFVGYCAESSWEAIDLQGSGNYIFAEIPARLLCFEHVCNKSLDKYISDESSGLEWNIRYDIIRGICGGLHYLHEECHIVHLDLKPENILMDATLVPKIADFGLSRIFGDKQSRIVSQNCLGTHGYMSPEYLIQGIVSIKADVFSLGVIIIEILTGCRDYPLSMATHSQQLSEDKSPQSTHTSFQHFKKKILETWRNRLQKSQGDTILEQVRVCAELGIQCVEFNPGNRPVTKYMVDRLDEVSIMDGSIKTCMSSTSAVVQISSGQEEGCVMHHAKLADICKKVGAANTKSDIKVPFHSIPDEANKHHVLESIVCDKSVEPTCLELPLLEDITNNFSNDQEIARSPLGVVYKGKLSNGSTVGVKRFTISDAVSDQLFLDAINSLMSVKHINIVRFLGYCANAQGKVAREGGKSIIAMVRERLLCFEYLCNGNLQMHLTDESGGFGWHARYQTIKGICQGLQYFHNDCICHLDLKPENILFDEKMVPKILDYGFSRVLKQERRLSVLTKIDGSMAYMLTPEYLSGGEITLKSDVYSLGVLIMQIVTGQIRKTYSNIPSILESWRSRFELDAPKGQNFKNCYEQVKACIVIGRRCMDLNPGKRPIIRYIIDRLDKTETEQSIRRDQQTIFPSKATLRSLGDELKVSQAPPAPLGVQSAGMEVRSLGDDLEVSPASLAPPEVQSAGVESGCSMKGAQDRHQQKKKKKKKQEMQVLPPFREWLWRVINMSVGRRPNNEYQSVGFEENGPDFKESKCYQKQKAGIRYEQRYGGLSDQLSNINISKNKHHVDEISDEMRMSLVREKFVEAKQLASNENLLQSKEFHEALNYLNANKDLFLKFLEEPNQLLSSNHDFQLAIKQPQICLLKSALEADTGGSPWRFVSQQDLPTYTGLDTEGDAPQLASKKAGLKRDTKTIKPALFKTLSPSSSGGTLSEVSATMG